MAYTSTHTHVNFTKNFYIHCSDTALLLPDRGHPRVSTSSFLPLLMYSFFSYHSTDVSSFYQITVRFVLDIYQIFFPYLYLIFTRFNYSTTRFLHILDFYRILIKNCYIHCSETAFLFFSSW